MKVKAISDHILCTDGDFGDQKFGEVGLILKSVDNKSQGITSRWFKVFSRGPDSDYTSIEEGKWILVEYGRWTESFMLEDDRFPEGKKKCWKVDPKAVMAIADERPEDVFYYNSKVITAEKKYR